MSTLHPATAHFLMSLTAQVTDTLRWWGTAAPGKPISPDALTGLCPRRFPLNARGQMQLGVDETLWLRGRARYGVRR